MDKQRQNKAIMAKKLSHEDRGRLADRLHELYRVTANGTRDAGVVLEGLQGLIEGRSIEAHPMSRIVWPDWYGNPLMQINGVSDFLERYGDGQDGFRPTDIPPVPDDFIPRTETEVLLLAVYLPDGDRVKGLRRTFDSWWNFIVPPAGLSNWRWEGLKSATKHLRLAKGVEYRPGIRWVAFDPNAYRGKSPKDALAQSATDGTTLAHAEVLMVAALFPEWVFSWNEKSPFPNMSAPQLYYEGQWSGVPYLDRSGSKLRLDARDAGDASSDWSSPVVREC